MIGSGLTTIALGILAYKIANKSIGPVLGFAFVIKTVVHLGVAPTASALAERIPRKPFLVFLDITREMPVLVLPSVTQIWQIYSLSLCISGVCSAGQFRLVHMLEKAKA